MTREKVLFARFLLITLKMNISWTRYQRVTPRDNQPLCALQFVYWEFLLSSSTAIFIVLNFISLGSIYLISLTKRKKEIIVKKRKGKGKIEGAVEKKNLNYYPKKKFIIFTINLLSNSAGCENFSSHSFIREKFFF